MANTSIELPAYAKTIGIALDSWDDGKPVLGIDYSTGICGNPGMFHGGVVGALLEMAAVAVLDADMRAGHGPARLTPLNSTVEYLRAAGEERAFASAEIVKSGRRLATVLATLWQGNRGKPVATAIVNIGIAPLET
ncbi:MAG: PaaI family thioesterase [Novosphingobium sp.]|nr:PaaI family thioesterase [Novosphingobium sp.]